MLFSNELSCIFPPSNYNKTDKVRRPAARIFKGLTKFEEKYIESFPSPPQKKPLKTNDFKQFRDFDFLTYNMTA